MTHQELTLEQVKPISGGRILKLIKKSIKDIVIVEFPRPTDSIQALMTVKSAFKAKKE